MSPLVFSLLVVMAQPKTQGKGQMPPRVADVDHGEETVRLAHAEAARWKIVREDGRQTPLELRDKPILKWSNATNGELYGSVVLWTVEGRPEALASMYRWYGEQQKFHAEFKSLSTRPLKATREGEDQPWDARQSDTEFRELKNQSPPADAASKRLTQMREIARRFSATLVPPTEGTTSLRLLTQPLYRYETTPKDVVDGALFAFVQGTDPEILLLIEAEKTENGGRWNYAVGRLNMFELHLALDDQEVWHAERVYWRDVIKRDQPYVVVMLPY